MPKQARRLPAGGALANQCGVTAEFKSKGREGRLASKPRFKVQQHNAA